MDKVRSPTHTDIAAFVRDTHGFTPLHFACEERNAAKLVELLRSDTGPDIYARSAGFGKKTYTASSERTRDRPRHPI